jgi:hypothetical protein
VGSYEARQWTEFYSSQTQQRETLHERQAGQRNGQPVAAVTLNPERESIRQHRNC